MVTAEGCEVTARGRKMATCGLCSRPTERTTRGFLAVCVGALEIARFFRALQSSLITNEICMALPSMQVIALFRKVEFMRSWQLEAAGQPRQQPRAIIHPDMMSF